MPKNIIIGSRGSELALWQAHYTRDLLISSGLNVEIKIIKTQGDKIQHLSFDKMEGKGFFTKELEEALLSGDIDLAVHSHKDLPTTNPPGLKIAGVSYRENCSETLLIRPEAYDPLESFSLKKRALVGTSSVRRKSQLLHFRPDLELKDLRGNVPTRISRLQEGMYDAIMLATAGINRLQIQPDDLHRVEIPPELFIPAPAQGVLAFQIRENDVELHEIIRKINHPDVEEIIGAERWVLNQMDGGCQLPLGVFCKKTENKFRIWASMKVSSDKPLRRMYAESNQAHLLSEKVLSNLLREENRTVFISRNSEDAKIFCRQARDYGFKIIAQSPIAFQQVKIQQIPATDWIFFSSKKSVDFLFNQQPSIATATKLAAIGSGTADALKRHGVSPDFEGNDQSTSDTAENFLKIANGKSVLFPVAENGMRSVQKICEQQLEIQELVIYRTISQKIQLYQKPDILVFTSPSAFENFHRQFDKQQGIYVAIGISTYNSIKSAGIDSVQMTYATHEQALADLVCGL